MKFNKKFLIILLLAAAAAYAAYASLKPKETVYKTEKVIRGAITQEVAETGTVKKGDTVNLSFKNSGTIDRINAAKGQEVSAGDVLAELDSRQLKVQLAQARANLDFYNLQLEKLRKGAATEDIGIIESQVRAAQSALASAEQSLVDAQNNAGQKLNSAYKDAGSALSSAYIKAYNGRNFSDLLQRTHFTPRDDDSIAVWDAVQKMDVAIALIKNYSGEAQLNAGDVSLDPVFAAAKVQLANIESRLRSIRAICEKTPWRDAVEQTYKDTLDLHIGYMVSAQASFNSAVEVIALQKAANDLAVNSAQAGVDAADAALKTAAGQLAKTVAGPRAEDVGVLESQVAQARAQIDLLNLQISDSRLVAPVAGQITEVNGKIGETVSMITGGALVAIAPADPYTVEVDIYEEDVVKEKIGDPVRISPAAIPDKVFAGRVLSIDPAGRLVNGVVYYPTKIAFDEMPQGLKPEMTADIVIVTAFKEDVLQISETALQKNQDDGYFVRILEDDGRPQEANVEVGIKSKGMAEIVSGLSEGQEVIIP
ncbi:MAG: efflux RND transporter periplasmic adaptor subunit [Candidatus Nealsonbacteria bacterium DGGOD1a]|nr:MAG: efflux RND transporter periplasmic adaptor subunit [Candidatus Nealsonbacteria bacterium DGGOD1a]